MGITDDELDATSRNLLTGNADLKRLEEEQRRTARSSDEFHELAERVDTAARDVFEAARIQLHEAREDSPLPAERAEQDPGDWTDGE